MVRRRLLAAAVALITVGGGAAIAPPAVSVPASGRTTAVAADPDVGTDSGAPHAAANRVPARTRVVTRGAATVSDVDFGNLTFGRYRTPVRGVLVTPTGSRADKRRGTELRVVVRLADGRRWMAYVPETHPALLDRASADSNGSYVVSTVRIALPAWVTRARLASVGLGGLHGGRVDVRGIDVLTGRR